MNTENVTVDTNDKDAKINGTLHNDGNAALRDVAIELTNLPEKWSTSNGSFNRIASGESVNFSLNLNFGDVDSLEEGEEVVHATASDRTGEIASAPVTVSIVSATTAGTENPPGSEGEDDGNVTEKTPFEECMDKAEESRLDLKTKFGCRWEYGKYTGVGDFISRLINW